MAMRNELPYPPNGLTWVRQHDTLCWINHVDRGFFPYWHPKVESVEFLNIVMRFQDSQYDELYFYLADRGVSDNELDNIVLIIGSVQTGDRLILTNTAHKDRSRGEGVVYSRYYYWQKLVEGDDNIRIASEEKGIDHILVNNGPRGDSHGYQSPFRILIELDDSGVIRLKPDYEDSNNTRQEVYHDVTPGQLLLPPEN